MISDTSTRRAYPAGHLDGPNIVASTQSWVGHVQHAETEGLRRAIFSQAVFMRGTGQEAASACSVAGPGSPNPELLRASARDWLQADDRDDFLGFRLVQDLSEEPFALPKRSLSRFFIGRA